MAQAKILVDGELVTYRQAQIKQQNDQVPEGSSFATVFGGSAEPAEASFLSRLRQSAEMIGSHTDVVRAAVAQNADALVSAVESMQEVEQGATDWASTQTEMITNTAATTSASDIADANEFVDAEGGSTPSTGASGGASSPEAGSADYSGSTSDSQL